jgi:hypothetical protein
LTRVAPVRAPQRAVRDEDPTMSLPEQIDAMATELNLLSYCHTQPEAFLERRDELAKRLRRLVRRVARDPSPETDFTTYRPKTDVPARLSDRARVRTIIVRRA